MMNYKALEIVFNNSEDKDIIIARLSEYPFEGFEEKDNELLAYIPSEKWPDEKVLEAALRGCKYQVKDIPNQNWNTLWESNYQSVLLDDFCGIRAKFHPHFEGVKYEININPRMSFGTGHHATTKLMMKMMKPLEFVGKSVLDFGTGTGVLAILAQKMGAESGVGVDYDENAVENAKENAIENNATNLQFFKKDAPNFINEQFDFVFANINRNTLLAHAEGLKNRVKPGGILLLSGVLEKDKIAIIERFEPLDFKVKIVLKEEGWLGIQMRLL